MQWSVVGLLCEDGTNIQCYGDRQSLKHSHDLHLNLSNTLRIYLCMQSPTKLQIRYIELLVVLIQV